MIPDQLAKQRAAAPQAEHLDLEDIARIVESHGGERSTLMTVLGDIQDKYRYLPEKALRIVADRIDVPLVDVYAVATFYHSFSLKPRGKHVVQCCLGTACHVRGGSGIAEEIERQLGIAPGETTPDMEFTFETVNCLGACALGPVVVVDGRYFPQVEGSQVSKILSQAGTGPEDAGLTEDERPTPIEVTCPHCERSLMNSALAIDGHASIALSFRVNGSVGSIALSSLRGSTSLQSDPPVTPDTVAQLLCPHCRTALNGSGKCSACGAPMATLKVRGGGTYAVCPRIGCDGHTLSRNGGEGNGAGG